MSHKKTMQSQKAIGVIATLLISLFSVGYGYFEYFYQPQDAAVELPVKPRKELFDASRVWSSTHDMTANENAAHHFEKHGEEMGLDTQLEYVQAAINFVSKPPSGTLTNKQKDNDTTYFNPKTGEFAVKSKKGRIRTYFRLDPKIHGYKSNMDYFNEQARKAVNNKLGQ